MFSEQFKSYVIQKYESRLPLFGKEGERIEKELEGCGAEEALLLRFFYATMPISDVFRYGFSVFYGFAAHAVWLRREAEWCRRLPEDVFAHFVAYYRINTESIVDCRAFFWEQLADRIRGLTAEEAVLEVNYWCAEHAGYESTDERTQSPMSVYLSGSGRCGEESTFLVTALRSVGIAARQVYTPRWAHCDDNHAWVEVYLDGSGTSGRGEEMERAKGRLPGTSGEEEPSGRWHYVGACEPEEVMDRGWFGNAATRAVLVYARTFSDYLPSLKEEILCRDGAVVYLNATQRYAATKQLTVLVTKDGNPVPDARVGLEILNMAEWAECLSAKTDADGVLRLNLGKGDVQLRARKGEWEAEAICPAETKKLTLCLEDRNAVPAVCGQDGSGVPCDGRSEAVFADEQREGDGSARIKKEAALCGVKTTEAGQEGAFVEIKAPADGVCRGVVPTEEQRERGRRCLKEAEEKRKLRQAAFYRESGVVPKGAAGSALPDEGGLLDKILKRAGGNQAELRRFLAGPASAKERYALLVSLSDKDYRDVRAEVLEEHLQYGLGLKEHVRLGTDREGRAVYGRLSEPDFVKYVLCPRVGFEELTGYRAAVSAFFGGEEKETFFACPGKLWKRIGQEWLSIPEEDYRELILPPEGMLKGRIAGEESRRIFFVAVCRTLGIPARLNPVDGNAEYLENGRFVRADGEPEILPEPDGHGWVYANAVSSRTDHESGQPDTAPCRTDHEPGQPDAALCQTDHEPGRPDTAPCWTDREPGRPDTALCRTDRESGRLGATLSLTVREPDQWSYGQNWSLGKRTGEGFQTLNCCGLRFPSDGRLELPLAPGTYRLIVSSRMPNGNQFMDSEVFRLEQGDRKEKAMKLHTASIGDMLLWNELPDFPVRERDGNRLESRRILADGRHLLIFLEEGREPGEHVLNELLEAEEMLEEASFEVLLMVSGAEALHHPTLMKVLERLPGIRLLYDEGLADAEPIARRMYVDPDKLPLLVAVEPGCMGVYACSGYHVGSVRLAGKILNRYPDGGRPAL